MGLRNVKNGMLLFVCMLFISGCQDGTIKQDGMSKQDKTSKIETILSEDVADEQLADFLAGYYQIPKEYLAQTRYYYNKTDLNEDGRNEIFVVTVGEYTQCDSGDPALLLQEEENGYCILQSFESVRTPVYVSSEKTDGWHDLIFPTHGGKEKTGFRRYHYAAEHGYESDDADYMEEFLKEFSGKKILADNFIDDMDRGDYLTLETEE